MEVFRKNRAVQKLGLLLHSGRKTRRGSQEQDITEGFGHPSLFHATVVIFLEFFAWGLMTSPTINALKIAFPTGTFLKNGIIQGVKGLLSFLSAPLIGALSDVWGRKSFLLLSVFFTCLPIPLLLFSAKLYFVGIALSGAFAVTFSIVFAYVADCTAENDRGYSYGVVSATFAASLVLSPALGTYISDVSTSTGQNQVVILATLITIFNILFIVLVLPESLPEAARKVTWGSAITWEQADPFASLRKVGTDVRLLRLSIIVFLSYLPEAGQYSCFFLYLRQIVGFSLSQVSLFIAILCLMSVVSQTTVLSCLMRALGYKYTIIIGLVLQAVQLFIYGIWTTPWLMWVAGVMAALSTIIYPAISALVSKNADPEQQGVVLGILTGMRGLCMGLGPAIFGLCFYLSHVHLDEQMVAVTTTTNKFNIVHPPSISHGNVTEIPTLMAPSVTGGLFKGLPFLLGVIPVLLALMVSLFIKERGSLLIKDKSRRILVDRNRTMSASDQISP